jgi:hypothetical protein
VADVNSSDGAAASNEQGVLANLPRTRPQRASARRVAARDGARATAPRGSARDSAPRATKTTPTATRAKTAPKRQQTAPLQGFECDSEAATGSVQPPGAIELLGSAAEVVGELAKAGVSRSERLLKDVISRLPLA